MTATAATSEERRGVDEHRKLEPPTAVRAPPASGPTANPMYRDVSTIPFADWMLLSARNGGDERELGRLRDRDAHAEQRREEQQRGRTAT